MLLGVVSDRNARKVQAGRRHARVVADCRAHSLASSLVHVLSVLVHAHAHLNEQNLAHALGRDL